MVQPCKRGGWNLFTNWPRKKSFFGKRARCNLCWRNANFYYHGVRGSDILFLKHDSSILRLLSNTVCGSWKSQARSPWAKQHRSIMEKPLGWMTVWECYWHALEKGCLAEVVIWKNTISVEEGVVYKLPVLWRWHADSRRPQEDQQASNVGSRCASRRAGDRKVVWDEKVLFTSGETKQINGPPKLVVWCRLWFDLAFKYASVSPVAAGLQGGPSGKDKSYVDFK